MSKYELPTIVVVMAMSAALLAACKTQPALEPQTRTGLVGATIVEAEDTRHYEIKANSHYDYPVQAPSNAMPACPQDMLAARLPPVRIKVRVIVSEAGFVSQCAPIDPSDAVNPRFLANIQDAVRGWRYMPLVLIEDAPVQTSSIAHGPKTTYQGTATSLPFHEDYEFTFSQRDGKGPASMSQSSGAAPSN